MLHLHNTGVVSVAKYSDILLALVSQTLILKQVCALTCVCVCVCVCARAREREREGERVCVCFHSQWLSPSLSPLSRVAFDAPQSLWKHLRFYYSVGFFSSSEESWVFPRAQGCGATCSSRGKWKQSWRKWKFVTRWLVDGLSSKMKMLDRTLIQSKKVPTLSCLSLHPWVELVKENN